MRCHWNRKGCQLRAQTRLRRPAEAKNWLLSKKMQNILLLNSENSIPECTPVEFQTVLSGCISPTQSRERPGLY